MFCNGSLILPTLYVHKEFLIDLHMHTSTFQINLLIFINIFDSFLCQVQLSVAMDWVSII